LKWSSLKRGHACETYREGEAYGSIKKNTNDLQ
jgi:hypothetical protein